MSSNQQVPSAKKPTTAKTAALFNRKPITSSGQRIGKARSTATIKLSEIKARKPVKFEPIDIASAMGKKAPFGATRCGDCLYFKDSRHPSYDAPCSKMGMLARGVAPTCFAPNINGLKGKGIQMATALNVLAGQLSTQQLRTIGTLMTNADRLRRYGFGFLEKVFFSVGSPRYLSNYYAGHVVGPAGQSGHLIVLGSKRTGTSSIVAYLDRESVLNQQKFNERRDVLVSRGLLYDPDLTQKKPPLPEDDSKLASYLPPTIDTPIESIEARTSTNSNVRKRKYLKKGAGSTSRDGRVSGSVELVF